jgi:predicted nucleotidyltransferase
MFGVTMRVEIKNEAQRCAAEIRKVSPEARVIVFGSSIDENVRNPRDIDLLVVLPKQANFKALRREILAIPRTTWPLDIIVVPDDFLAEKLKASSNFYAFVCNEGIELGTEQKISA